MVAPCVKGDQAEPCPTKNKNNPIRKEGRDGLRQGPQSLGQTRFAKAIGTYFVEKCSRQACSVNFPPVAYSLTEALPL